VQGAHLRGHSCVASQGLQALQPGHLQVDGRMLGTGLQQGTRARVSGRQDIRELCSSPQRLQPRGSVTLP